MRPPGSAAELERRRRRAVALLRAGHSQAEVARWVGASPSSVHRWRRMARRGPQGLAARPQPGPSPRLTTTHLRRLERLLRQGATAHGWATDLWTAARVTTLIQRHFGVRFHPEHVRKILKRRLGWTSQKPTRRARERDEAAIAYWREMEWPRLKKKRDG